MTYIEREATKEALLGWDYDPKDEDVEWAIDKIPAADVAPVKHGRWIKTTWMSYIGGESLLWDENGNPVPRECSGYHCSECNRYEHKKEPYCNCGAKMDLED